MDRKLIRIKEQTKIKVRENLDTTDIDGDKVMMDLDKGYYFMLNEVAGRIWDIVQRPISIEKVINTLLEEYEVEPDVCREQVIHFIHHLVDDSLLSVVGD